MEALLKVLFVSIEVSPFAKVGGLADVAGSLPKALKAQGHDVRIVMPSYKMVEDDPRFKLTKVIDDLTVSVGPNWTKQAYVLEGLLDEVPVYFIGTDEWFTETVSSETVYLPGADHYLFFSNALLEMAKKLNWKPDVVHCNDWHTGFTPVIMRERFCKMWDSIGVVYTIHNLAYQGEFGFDTIDKAGLPHHLFNFQQLETFGSVNFLKAGCVFSDQTNTVSETYAKEIQTQQFGCRLEGLMQHLDRNGRLHGILNGIDTEVFDPATDPYLAKHYSLQDPSGKAACKLDILERLEMRPIEGAPLLGVVSRLSNQKGMDLMLQIAREMFDLPCQLVVQGLGDEWLTQQFKDLEKEFPEHFRFVNAFDVAMAQRIYAGSDVFLMPSAFEPCGLGQMIALRYGTIPVVRHTGGLADTVFEGQNGFVFADSDPGQLVEAVKRMHETYSSAEPWAELIQKAMSGEYGWDASARKYAELYERAVASRH